MVQHEKALGACLPLEWPVIYPCDSVQYESKSICATVWRYCGLVSLRTAADPAVVQLSGAFVHINRIEGSRRFVTEITPLARILKP